MRRQLPSVLKGGKVCEYAGLCVCICVKRRVGAAQGPCIITLLYSCEWNRELIWLEARWKEEDQAWHVDQKRERKKEKEGEGGGLKRRRRRRWKWFQPKWNKGRRPQSHLDVHFMPGTFDWVTQSSSADVCGTMERCKNLLSALSTRRPWCLYAMSRIESVGKYIMILFY